MRRNERYVLFVLGVAVAVAVAGALLLPGFYFVGLTLVPEKPQATTFLSIPEVVRAALWADLSGDGPIRLKPITPWSFVQLRICRALASRSGQAKREAKEACLRQHAGIVAADDLAKIHVAKYGFAVGGLAQVATAAWVTRNWTGKMTLDELASQGDFGHGWRGIDQAALGYLGKHADILAAADAALLAALIRRPQAADHDPWCRPTEALDLRNHVLRRMEENGALTKEALSSALQAPLGILDRRCAQAAPARD
ncbi:MAG TPA: transglycosylase domain-containing protein [Thermoanaerobaculia bacterium]|nr:transglycosylase domain-containing protein [Thermoanaerobaculia bacterium]